MSGKVKRYIDPQHAHRWRVVARNGNKLANGGEGYAKTRGVTNGLIGTAVAIFNDPVVGPLVRKKLGMPADIPLSQMLSVRSGLPAGIFRKLSTGK